MNALWEFESPLPHKKTTDNTLNVSRFSFIKNYCAKSETRINMNYRGLRIVKGKRWYVEYHYLIPEGLRHFHDDKKWKRIRVYEDINRRIRRERERFTHLNY
jgi:hypothetical protein